MKPSGNESLHYPDHEMICDRNFSIALPPTEAPKVRVMTSPRKYASVDYEQTIA